MTNGSGAAAARGHAARQAFGNVAQNAIQPPNAVVYLQLQFLAPDEAAPRNFPPQFPVTVRFGQDTDAVSDQKHEIELRTSADGKLQFPARHVDGKPWRKFTLCFKSPADSPRHLYYEKRTDPRNPGFTSDDKNLTSKPTTTRFFSLPTAWSLKVSDWAEGATTFTDNGRFTAASGQIEHTKVGRGRQKNAPRDIGAAGAPVQLVLNPHWKFIRFEFFDRYYGPTFGGRDGHGKRISVPPLVLEGFRDNTDPAADTAVSARSNWTIGADIDNLLQCVPWILRKTADGADLPKLSGSNLGLRFRMSDEADKLPFVVSESKTARAVKYLNADSPPASPPGPQRLKAYDLPKLWKSKNYFAREIPASPPGPGKIFNTITDEAGDLIGKADSKDTPLVFCLDDMVLTDHQLAIKPLNDGERVAVFWHTFSDRFLLSSPPGAAVDGFSRLGVYKPGDDPHWQGYPYSDITMSPPYYVSNYPDWSRLVVAQGNLWDAFAKRTEDGADVVGARAAVRWAATTSPPHSVAIGTTLGAPPARTDTTFLAQQPYWRSAFVNHSDNPQPGAIHHDEWTAAFAPPDPYFIGRFDLAHVRCTDWHGEDEVTTLMRYHRFAFDLGGVTAHPPLAGAYGKPEDWAKEAVDNIIDRWNAVDAYNPARPWVLPKSPDGASPPAAGAAASPPVKAQVVTLVQYLSPPVAHHRIATVAPTSGSWMSQNGTGEFRVNSIRHEVGMPPALDDWGGDRWPVPGRGLAAAHEAGHAGSMPDEYPWNQPAQSRGYKHLHMPANPYQYDYSNAHTCLMKGNSLIRTRYYWHAAEWLHSLPGFDGNDWKLAHGQWDDYHLPHYPHAEQGRNFYSWPVRFNLRTRPGGEAHWFDSFLYFLGKEQYSQEVLAGRPDGILVSVLRMFFNLDAVDAGMRDDVCRILYQRINQQVNGWLNTGRLANFQTASGARQQPAFERCALRFEVAVNLNGAETWQSGVLIQHSSWLEANSPHHLYVEFVDHAAFDPINATWNQNVPASSNEVIMAWHQPTFDGWGNPDQMSWLNDAADEIAERVRETLGFSATAGTPNWYLSPPGYRHVVKTVMDNAAPNPTIT